MILLRYTAWDGTQRVRLAADRVFESFAEYLSETDDVEQALDWLLRQGLEIEGVRVVGLDEVLEEVRAALRARYGEFNLGSATSELRRKLDDIIELETEALQRMVPQTALTSEKRAFLESLPLRLSEAINRLRDYRFEDP